MDTTSPDGAMKLAQKITEHWEAKGLAVVCSVVKIRLDDDVKVIPSNMWQLRSNLRFDRHGNAYTVDELA